MLKLKISYQEEQELKDFLELLPLRVIASIKIPKKQHGAYKKAYAEIKFKIDEQGHNMIE